MSDCRPCVGVDGCPGGWIAVARSPEGSLTTAVHTSFAEILTVWPEAIIAIDIPIGCPAAGARACDDTARRLLGPRRASVFPAPLRPLLQAATQAEASALRRAIDGSGYGIQAFNILVKVREVDLLLTPMLQQRVFEVHPELSFRALNGGQPLPWSKKTRPGQRERVRLLRRSLAGSEPLLYTRPPRPATRDDLSDACAALWSAERIAAGCGEPVAALAARDSRGLQMQIWY